MRTIWKFAVFPGRFFHDMPQGAQVLDVQVQDGEPQLWALVDPALETEARWFRVFGTGQSVPDATLRYVGTFQLEGGMLVLHLFSETAAKGA